MFVSSDFRACFTDVYGYVSVNSTVVQKRHSWNTVIHVEEALEASELFDELGRLSIFIDYTRPI